jgi:sugar phosphate isomerase/epimerase
LYSVRDLQETLPEIIARVGETSFEGVEFAKRLRNADPTETAAALEANEIEPVAAHADLPEIEAAIEGRNDLLDRYKTIGCDRVVVPHVAPEHFRNQRAVGQLADRLTDVATDLGTHGIELGYHTVRFDCYPFLPSIAETLLTSGPLPGGIANHARRVFAAYRLNDPSLLPNDTGLFNLFSQTRPGDVFFELESAELTAAGLDPAAVLSRFERRSPLLHLRDVAPTGRFGAYENAQPGEGVVDFASLVDTASAEGVEWLVHEDETDHHPTTKITEGAAFLDGLLNIDHPSSRTGTASADD